MILSELLKRTLQRSILLYYDQERVKREQKTMLHVRKNVGKLSLQVQIIVRIFIVFVIVHFGFEEDFGIASIAS